MTVLDNDDPNKFLYHYTTKEVALEKIMPPLLLRMGPYSATKDPRENKDWTHYFSATAVGLEDEQFWKHADEGWEEIRRLRNRFRILCLTLDAQEKPTSQPIESRGYGLSRMWTQYAGNHSGACLVFDRATLTDEINNSVGSPDRLMHRPIEYTILSEKSIGYDADYYELNVNDIKEKGPALAIRAHVETHYPYLLFTKSIDWRDENEIRWVYLSNDDDPELMISIRESLVAIIVGVEFPEIYTPILKRICGPLQIQTLKIGWFRGHFTEPFPIEID